MPKQTKVIEQKPQLDAIKDTPARPPFTNLITKIFVENLVNKGKLKKHIWIRFKPRFKDKRSNNVNLFKHYIPYLLNCTIKRLR